MLNRTTKVIVVAALTWGLALPAWSQQGTSTRTAIDQLESLTSRPLSGFPTDWSHHNLVVSAPNPALPTYDAVQREPRYWMQVLRRNLARESESDHLAFSNGAEKKKIKINDWTMFTGGNFITPPSAVIDMFPAKYNFTTDNQSCTGDFVVFSTEAVPNSTRASIVGLNNLYAGTGAGACGVQGGGVVPTFNWAYNTRGISLLPLTTSPALSLDGTQLAFVQGARLILLKWNPSSAGHSSAPIGHTTSGSKTITTTTAFFEPSTDVGLQISGTAIPPNTTITSVASTTSATISNNATANTTTGTFHIAAETGVTPGVPNIVTPANYRSCTAPCMTSFLLNHADTRSAPFVDYSDDTLYVGDNGNVLYQFTGVFLGTPTETGFPWPVTVSGAAGGLSAPVFDSASGLVFVSDITGGFLFSVSSTAPAIQRQSAQLSFNNFLNDAPIVDSSTERVYYFSSEDNGILIPGHAAVFQLPAQFTSGATGSEEQVGAGFRGGDSTHPGTMFSGAFDATYFRTSGTSGNLYTVGNQGGNGGVLSSGFLNLYQIPIISNIMLPPITGPVLVLARRIFASPITEFDNGNDLIFFSVSGNGNNVSGWNCADRGCLVSFNINSGLSTSSTPASSTNFGGAGGATAVIVDNSVTTPNFGGAQLYFLPLENLNCVGNTNPGGTSSTGKGNGACATQASQASLTE